MPWWEKWTYCNGLKSNTETDTWLSVYNIYVTNMERYEPKYLEFLACSEYSSVIIIILINNYLKPVNSFLFTIAKHAKNNETLKYVLENFSKIKPT